MKAAGSWYTESVSRPSAIDAPVTLGDLLGLEELRDIVALYHELHGMDVSIADRAGAVVASTVREPAAVHAALAHDRGEPEEIACAPDACLALHPMRYEGRHLATVLVGPYAGGAAASAKPEAGVAAGQAAGQGRAGNEAAAVARHVASMLEIIAHHAHARVMTSTLHSEAMEENFQELAAKNERLQQAVDHMQEVDRLKSSFLATVSHELRTPLTSVIGYAEMLYEGLAGPLNNEQREYMQTILNKADQLLQLITALLEASILESGPVPMQREPLSMRQIIDRVVSGLGPQARARRIEVRALEPDLPRALGDARKIRQVLRNLIANAVKFTSESGCIEIDVQVGALSRHDGPDTERGLRVMVVDSGIGIPLENQELIFEPFFQVDSSSTRRYGGTGLGLTLAKNYIEANGGYIWVESTPGQGSSFTFSIPVVPEELARFLAAREPSREPSREPPSSS
jgi:two-component system sensor histidine kinase BarA